VHVKNKLNNTNNIDARPSHHQTREKEDSSFLVAMSRCRWRNRQNTYGEQGELLSSNKINTLTLMENITFLLLGIIIFWCTLSLQPKTTFVFFFLLDGI